MWTHGKGWVQQGGFIKWKKRQVVDTCVCLNVNRACLEVALSIIMVSGEMLGVGFQIGLNYGEPTLKTHCFFKQKKKKKKKAGGSDLKAGGRRQCRDDNTPSQLPRYHPG